MREGFADDLAAVSRIDDVSRILEVVCRTTGLGFSAVARVTESRWIACAVRDEIEFGLRPGGELVVDTTICDEIRRSGKLVVIDDAASDPEFRDHKTTNHYGIRGYISVPIVLPDGRFFGTLCAIDPRPARLNNPETIEMFRLFASLIAIHLETQLSLITSERDLRDERETAQLREQFIAVLGHDLRGPLGAIRMGAHLLAQSSDAEDAGVLHGIISGSVNRMDELIENMLDLARGRIGGGFPRELVDEESLQAALLQVIAEQESASPGRIVDRRICIGRPIVGNAARLAQMLANLLGNALTHGDSDGPVSVDAEVNANAFELSVTNQGPAIPLDIQRELFQPYFRGTSETGQQGLGLGLYIASEIARVHGGSIAVESSEAETRFTYRMPIDGE